MIVNAHAQSKKEGWPISWPQNLHVATEPPCGELQSCYGSVDDITMITYLTSENPNDYIPLVSSEGESHKDG